MQDARHNFSLEVQEVLPGLALSSNMVAQITKGEFPLTMVTITRRKWVLQRSAKAATHVC